MGDKEISNCNVPCAFAAQGFSILFKKDGTLVVLVQDVLSDLVPLSFQEMASIKDGGIRLSTPTNRGPWSLRANFFPCPDADSEYARRLLCVWIVCCQSFVAF